MKKIIFILVCLFVSLPQLYARCVADSCDCAHTSKSYLSVRQQFQSVSPEMVSLFRSDFTHASKDGIGGAMQLVPFGSRSTRSSDLGRYFMPFCDNTVNVREEEQVNPRNNMLAAHFNIFTQNGTFESTVTINPRQTVGGLGMQIRQSFLQNKKEEYGFWVSLSAPVIHVRNDLNFCEKIINAGGGVDTSADENAVPNMKQAFTQPAWKYGKISCKTLTETKIADIEVKVGMEWLKNDPCHVEGYIGFVIPTGTKPTAEYIFEPIVGNGRHFGVNFGSAAGIQIYASEDESKTVRIEHAHHALYLFKKKQKRSFDLKNKPWSRYMETYQNEAEATEASTLGTPKGTNFSTPGINVLTQDVDVTPGLSYNINSALTLKAGKFRGEIGYNFYARQAECVKLACPWTEGAALKHADGLGTTNDARNITGNIKIEQADPTTLADYQISIIKEEDLDLSSAASPYILSNTLYGAFGYTWDERAYPVLLGGGASYEFAPNNNAMINRWTMWAKVGFAY